MRQHAFPMRGFCYESTCGFALGNYWNYCQRLPKPDWQLEVQCSED